MNFSFTFPQKDLLRKIEFEMKDNFQRLKTMKQRG